MTPGAAKEAGYLPAAKAFHWITAALVVAVFPLGAVIKFVEDDAKAGFYLFHESLGLLVLLVVLARLAFRLRHPPPPPEGLPAPMRLAAAAVHWALYAALVAMPVSGFLATNAWGFPLVWFGVLPVPSPIGEDKAIAPVLSEIHETIAWAILALFLMHVSAVLYHHAVRRDGTLRRMI